MQLSVIGAGVAGLACALELAERGAEVEVLERGPHLGAQVSAREVGKRNGRNRLRAIEPAPGSYARQRVDAR